MTDRELLQAAAKAAGIDVYFDDVGQCCKRHPRDMMSTWLWNPLTDDGDALRLAVKLRLLPVIEEWSDGWWIFVPSQPGNAEPVGSDPYAATRRAIVRAAAAMVPK